jgi:SAM-dependent methyltransferase
MSSDAAAAAAAAAPAAPPPLYPAEARALMQQVMPLHGGAAAASGWAAVWDRKLTVWDLKAPTPLMQAEVAAALADGRVPAGGAALVPGCGAGHDVRALAAQGLRVVGADVVEQAIEAARAVAAGQAGAQLVCADFFAPAASPLLAPASFDLICDYTFFCAITPAQRAAWGARTAALLRPGGRLLTLMFPLAADEVAADPAATGPPHPVSLAEYRRALEPHGLALEGEPRRSELSVPQRASNEMVGWWRKAA